MWLTPGFCSFLPCGADICLWICNLEYVRTNVNIALESYQLLIRRRLHGNYIENSTT